MRFILFMVFLTLLACEPSAEKDSLDSLFSYPSAEELAKKFGKENVTTDTTTWADGTTHVTTHLYKATPRAVQITWLKEKTLEVPAMVIISRATAGGKGTWKTSSGLSLDITETELVKINGKSFNTIVSDENKGLVSTWENGKLELGNALVWCYDQKTEVAIDMIALLNPTGERYLKMRKLIVNQKLQEIKRLAYYKTLPRFDLPLDLEALRTEQYRSRSTVVNYTEFNGKPFWMSSPVNDNRYLLGVLADTTQGFTVLFGGYANRWQRYNEHYWTVNATVFSKSGGWLGRGELTVPAFFQEETDCKNITHSYTSVLNTNHTFLSSDRITCDCPGYKGATAIQQGSIVNGNVTTDYAFSKSN